MRKTNEQLWQEHDERLAERLRNMKPHEKAGDIRLQERRRCQRAMAKRDRLDDKARKEAIAVRLANDLAECEWLAWLRTLPEEEQARVWEAKRVEHEREQEKLARLVAGESERASEVEKQVPRLKRVSEVLWQADS